MGSWIVTRIIDGSVIGEFYERSNVEKFNPATCCVETSLQYLTRINRMIKTMVKPKTYSALLQEPRKPG